MMATVQRARCSAGGIRVTGRAGRGARVGGARVSEKERERVLATSTIFAGHSSNSAANMSNARSTLGLASRLPERARRQECSREAARLSLHAPTTKSTAAGRHKPNTFNLGDMLSIYVAGVQIWYQNVHLYAIPYT